MSLNKWINVYSISLSAVFATLYTIGVVALAPISFYITQVRIADALLPLTILFGWPAILGVTIGCIVANLFGGLGVLDIIGGGMANLIAGYWGWRVGQMNFKGSWLIGSSLETIIVSSVVGSYLSILFTVPFMLSFLGVLIGSIISINGIGYLLLKTLSRSRFIRRPVKYGEV